MERIEQQPSEIAFLPMVWGAWGQKNLPGEFNAQVVPKIKSGDVRWGVRF